jgi:hypothetical protein
MIFKIVPPPLFAPVFLRHVQAEAARSSLSLIHRIRSSAAGAAAGPPGSE